MKPLQTNASPVAEYRSRPTPMTFEELRKLNPKTQAVILGGAIARRKAKDAKLCGQHGIDSDTGAANKGVAVTLAK